MTLQFCEVIVINDQNILLALNDDERPCAHIQNTNLRRGMFDTCCLSTYTVHFAFTHVTGNHMRHGLTVQLNSPLMDMLINLTNFLTGSTDIIQDCTDLSSARRSLHGPWILWHGCCTALYGLLAWTAPMCHSLLPFTRVVFRPMIVGGATTRGSYHIAVNTIIHRSSVRRALLPRRKVISQLSCPT